MKTVIAGSRNLTDYRVVLAAIKGSGWEDQIRVVISGRCRGADTFGEMWAEEHQLPVVGYPYMGNLGRAGGPVRNRIMAETCDSAIVIWDGKKARSGSYSMIKETLRVGKPLYVYRLDKGEGSHVTEVP